MIDRLAAELQDFWATQGRRQLGPADVGPFKASVCQIVTDAVQAQQPIHEQSLASIHKSAGHYSKGRYWSAPYGYKIHIQRSYDGLISLGYIEERKKGVYTDYARLLTRYRATSRLLDLFDDRLGEWLSVVAPPRANQETIRLNIRQPDGHKILVDYVDTEHTRQMRASMALINKCLSRCWADLELDERQMNVLRRRMISKRANAVSLNDGDGILRLQDRTLYRVFNDRSFSTNGRLYGGWWQSIPREYRRHILINGKRTVELDYSGLHPNLIYALGGKDLDGDPYTLPISEQHGPDFRSLVKKAFNAMINADHELARGPRGINNGDYGLTWTELKAVIKERHAPVADQFFSAIGARLQHIDSEVAVGVLTHFAEMGVAVLPVHDSFIMHSGYESELRDVMRAKLRTAAGAEVPIQLSWTNWPSGKFSVEEADVESLIDNRPSFERRFEAAMQKRGDRTKAWKNSNHM